MDSASDMKLLYHNAVKNWFVHSLVQNQPCQKLIYTQPCPKTSLSAIALYRALSKLPNVICPVHAVSLVALWCHIDAVRVASTCFDHNWGVACWEAAANGLLAVKNFVKRCAFNGRNRLLTSCPSVCPHVSAPLLLDGITWNFILGTSVKVFRENPNSCKSDRIVGHFT